LFADIRNRSHSFHKAFHLRKVGSKLKLIAGTIYASVTYDGCSIPLASRNMIMGYGIGVLGKYTPESC
jgi:alpha-D-ribose 1-methylphosphonate 5-phosphate C-P lyase